jgi:hypothetical protein
MDDITDPISEVSPHALEIRTTIAGSLFADGSAPSYIKANELRKATNLVTKHCRECDFKCNPNRTKILVFKE